MTDRELLELAAKAAGYEWREDIAEYRKEHGLIGLWIDGVGTNWNPLEKCDNALRLAVKLGIDIEVNHESKTASTRWLNKKGNPASVTDYLTVYFGDGDPYAATRRAITRAAAEIGKAMP